MPGSLQHVDHYHRYCPGEEQVQISDAICAGRRRNNFPKCKGCQFNDGEKGAGANSSTADRGAAGAENAKRRQIESVFRGDDVRGAYPVPLDAETAWRIGMGTAQVLRAELRGYDRSMPEKSTVVVGMDMRKSSPELRDALIEGLRTGGSPVVDVGTIDTPQLWFAVNQLTCCGGVQVSGGHEAAGTNGLKICGRRARPVSSETGLGKICKIAQNTIRHPSRQMTDLREEDLSEKYRRFIRAFLKSPGGGVNPDRPLKLVVDASNGMAGRWIPIIFDDLDALDIVRLNFEHNGEFVHDPDPLVESSLAQLEDRCIRSKADVGICFDGDADRCVLVDNDGHPVRPDHLAALLARHMLKAAPGGTVAYDLRCSRVVPEEIRKSGGIPRRERSALLAKSVAGAKALFGADLAGRYYFRDNWYCDSALITLVEVINVLTGSGRPLSELLEPLRRYAHSGPRTFRTDSKREAIRKLASKFGDARIDYLEGITVDAGDWWFNVSPSSTEPLLHLNLEAKDPNLLDDQLAEVTPLLGTPVDPA